MRDCDKDTEEMKVVRKKEWDLENDIFPFVNDNCIFFFFLYSQLTYSINVFSTFLFTTFIVHISIKVDRPLFVFYSHKRSFTRLSTLLSHSKDLSLEGIS